MADKGKGPGGLYERPPELGKWLSFKTFLWNSETSSFLGRTFSSWAKILLFYCIFYLGLAGFFSALMALFYQTLDMDKPKWQQSSSLIGSNPGLGFRPMPPDAHVESTLIWYKNSDNNYADWVNSLESFLKPYTEPNPNHVKCDHDKAEPNKVCKVEVEKWNPCTRGKNFNYHEGAPCIFLKLNKIYGWVPEYYNESVSLPDNMPSDLKTHIKDIEKTQRKQLNTVWVSCEGENPADKENIGSVQYIPKRGFEGFYFPYLNVKGYLSPIIAVWFEKPARGVLINIECKAWAKNIVHDRAERRGSVHFEIMID